MALHVVYQAPLDPESPVPSDWYFTLVPREADPRCALEALATLRQAGPRCRARTAVWLAQGLRTEATCTLPAEHFGDHVDGLRGKIYARWRE